MSIKESINEMDQSVDIANAIIDNVCVDMLEMAKSSMVGIVTSIPIAMCLGIILHDKYPEIGHRLAVSTANNPVVKEYLGILEARTKEFIEL